jgi:hypothetical protein
MAEHRPLAPTSLPDDADFGALATRFLDGSLAADDLHQLNDHLRRDETNRREFVRMCLFAGIMTESLKPQLGAASAQDSPTIPPPVASSATVGMPVSPAVDDALHAAVGYLSSGWPVAYLIATVILGFGLAIGAVTRVSQPEHVVQTTHPSPFGRAAGGEGSERPTSPFPSIVGRITGVVDCRFAAGSGLPSPARGRGAGGEGGPSSGSPVTLGDKFHLISGLLEITYDTGAKVILQGPVTYVVESSAGGFLSVGRLTARVDSAKPQAASRKSEISNPQSPIPNPSLSTIHYPLFTVRTPTATVTDLGTEFGVEVAKSGETTSHVFRGSVRVHRTSADGRAEADWRVVGENETVRVEPSAGSRQIVTLYTFTPSHFIRDLPRQKIKIFDLVDAVAGGDGFSDRRNAGIHPLTGKIIRTRKVEDDSFSGDGQYHRVPELPFIDGIFVPDGRKGPVQVTSVGHTFEGFTNSHGLSSSYAWAGGVVSMLQPMHGMTVVPATLNGVDYSSAGHGWIFLHANKAITFDLEAIRRANPAYRLQQFKAVAGYTGPEEYLGDLLVLVDGQLKFRRRQINSTVGAMPVVVPLRSEDRFLTLCATDGGDGIGYDFVIFGDPQLELAPAQAGGRRSTDSTTMP